MGPNRTKLNYSKRDRFGTQWFPWDYLRGINNFQLSDDVGYGRWDQLTGENSTELVYKLHGGRMRHVVNEQGTLTKFRNVFKARE